MSTTPVPDAFFGLIIFMGVIGMLTERIWDLCFMHINDQFSVYTKPRLLVRFGVPVLGIVTSVAPLVWMFYYYSTHQVFSYLGHFYHVQPLFGLAACGVVVIHLLTPLVMVGILIRQDRLYWEAYGTHFLVGA